MFYNKRYRDPEYIKKRYGGTNPSEVDWGDNLFGNPFINFKSPVKN